MVNYDLPWNPNRIEQRFGRVHRIGQEEVCRLWNLVASNTREGEVFTRLLEKLDQMRQTYGGKVFDVLGEAFTDTPLRNLLLEAIQYGEREDVKAKMHEVIDASVGDGLKDLLDERALASEHLADADLHALRAAMDEARARRLQPHYIELAFKAAFTKLGGRIVKREQGRYEIANVPQHIRSAGTGPIATKYDRVTFDLAHVQPDDLSRADLLAPGHPLHDAVMGEAIRNFGGALNQGTVLVSSTLEEPQLLVGVVEEVADATGESVARRFGYAYVDQLRHRQPGRPGAVPRLRRRTRGSRRRRRPQPGLARRRRGQGDELDHRQPAPRVPRRGPAATAGGAREGPRPGDEAPELRERAAPAGRRGRLGEGAEGREAEGVLRQPQPQGGRARRPAPQAPGSARPAAADVDEAAAHRDRSAWCCRSGCSKARSRPTAPIHAKETKEVERRGVDLVMARERELGRKPVEQAFNNPGFDILSTDANGDTYRIEVKARIEGAKDFFVTHNEVMTGKNAVPRYRLALVRVDPRGAAARRGPLPRDPFATTDLGDFEATGVRGDWAKTWAKGTAPF